MYRACKHVVKGSALAGVGVAAVAYSTNPAFGTLSFQIISAKFVCSFCRIACALCLQFLQNRLCSFSVWGICGSIGVEF